MHLTDEALRALAEHSWPGNIRELRNVLERATLFASKRTITVGDLKFDPVEMVHADPVSEFETRLTLEEVERRHITRVLEDTGGHVASAAKRLGIPRSSLYAKLKMLRLKPSPFAESSAEKIS